MIVAPALAGSPGFLPDNIAAALAYVTPIPAIVFLRVPSFKRNHFVRFHSWQAIFLMLAGLAAAVAVKIIFSLLSLFPRFGYLLASLVVLLTVLAWGILWLVIVVKALQHDLFKLPVIGDLAERR